MVFSDSLWFLSIEILILLHNMFFHIFFKRYWNNYYLNHNFLKYICIWTIWSHRIWINLENIQKWPTWSHKPWINPKNMRIWYLENWNGHLCFLKLYLIGFLIGFLVSHKFVKVFVLQLVFFNQSSSCFEIRIKNILVAFELFHVPILICLFDRKRWALSFWGIV
jgi:hypothetical protein